MHLQLKIVGGLLIWLATLHLFFPWYFRWREELGSVSVINRQMMWVHTLFIALVLFMMGVLCLTCVQDLEGTILGRRMSFGLGVFWSIRLIIQFVGYSAELWWGKVFETVVHCAFSLLWLYFVIVFFLAAANR